MQAEEIKAMRPDNVEVLVEGEVGYPSRTPTTQQELAKGLKPDRHY